MSIAGINRTSHPRGSLAPLPDEVTARIMAVGDDLLSTIRSDFNVSSNLGLAREFQGERITQTYAHPWLRRAQVAVANVLGHLSNQQRLNINRCRELVYSPGRLMVHGLQNLDLRLGSWFGRPRSWMRAIACPPENPNALSSTVLQNQTQAFIDTDPNIAIRRASQAGLWQLVLEIFNNDSGQRLSGASLDLVVTSALHADNENISCTILNSSRIEHLLSAHLLSAETLYSTVLNFRHPNVQLAILNSPALATQLSADCINQVFQYSHADVQLTDEGVPLHHVEVQLAILNSPDLATQLSAESIEQGFSFSYVEVQLAILNLPDLATQLSTDSIDWIFRYSHTDVRLAILNSPDLTTQLSADAIDRIFQYSTPEVQLAILNSPALARGLSAIVLEDALEVSYVTEEVETAIHLKAVQLAIFNSPALATQLSADSINRVFRDSHYTEVRLAILNSPALATQLSADSTNILLHDVFTLCSFRGDNKSEKVRQAEQLAQRISNVGLQTKAQEEIVNAFIRDRLFGQARRVVANMLEPSMRKRLSQQIDRKIAEVKSGLSKVEGY